MTDYTPTREEVADELSGWPIGAGFYQTRVAHEEARDMADWLADVGFLARPLPSKEGLEDTISDVLREPFSTYGDVADAVLALLKGQDK